MVQELLAQVVLHVVLAIQVAGMVIVLWGVIEALSSLIRGGWRCDASGRQPRHFGEIRIRLGGKMVLGLEFFIASDIIQTVMVPSWESLGILAGIVAVRTIIAYFLEYEIRQAGEHRDRRD